MEPLLTEIARLASTFALAFFSFWAAIPAGLALGLSPAAVVLTTTLSYASGAALVTLVGGGLRRWLMQRMGWDSNTAPQGRLHHIWARYGLTGLALAAPMTVGAQAGAALGVLLAVPRLRLTAALTLGALAWSIALTAAVSLGVLAVGGAQP